MKMKPKLHSLTILDENTIIITDGYRRWQSVICVVASLSHLFSPVVRSPTHTFQSCTLSTTFCLQE